LSFNIKSVIAGLEAAAKMAETIVPEIAQLTPYGAIATKVIGFVGAASEVAQQLQKDMADEKIVLSSTDQAQVRELAQKLSDHDDALAKEIDAS
jgi:hypothetical protein